MPDIVQISISAVARSTVSWITKRYKLWDHKRRSEKPDRMVAFGHNRDFRQRDQDIKKLLVRLELADLNSSLYWADIDAYLLKNIVSDKGELDVFDLLELSLYQKIGDEYSPLVSAKELRGKPGSEISALLLLIEERLFLDRATMVFKTFESPSKIAAREKRQKETQRALEKVK